ncbi:MAG: RNA polymerase sigma factor [Lacipirellulaceae bacterium]
MEASEAPQTAQADAVNASSGPTIEELVRTHQTGVWRYLRYLGASAAEADDLTQEAFLTLVRGPFEPRAAAATAAYLRTTARNTLLQLRRRQKRQAHPRDFEQAEGVWRSLVAPEDDAHAIDRWSLLVEAARLCVETLEGRARLAIDLQYREHLSREACAERLAMSAEGVKTLLRRTREVIRQCIERRVGG